jgi:hypothetical protein
MPCSFITHMFVAQRASLHDLWLTPMLCESVQMPPLPIVNVVVLRRPPTYFFCPRHAPYTLHREV